MRFAYFLIFQLLSPLLLAETELMKVLDGDTVIVRDSGQMLHVRLLDIDAPELHQTYGKQSKRSLQQWCEPPVTLIAKGHDAYGRTLGHLLCNSQDASAYQISVGAAWFSSYYSQRRELAELEQRAQTGKRGLWQEINPMPPWQWRKLYGKNYQRQ